MKLSIPGLSLAAAVAWSSAILFVSVCNLIWPDYGVAFLDVIGSIYPGFSSDNSVVNVLIGSAWAFFDGAVGGAIIAAIHNLVARGPQTKKA